MLNPAIALLAWPLVAIWLFARLPFERAIIWSVLVSFLFLPSSIAIDLPGVPAMDKQSLPNLVLLLIVLAKAPRPFRPLPPTRIGKILVLVFLAGTFLTAMTNQDPIWIAERVLPGLSPYDALSDTVRKLLIVVPLLIGWQYLADAKAHREILKALFMAGLTYSVLMLFEVRMSPQLHTWVYGYFPHDFGQQYRWSGFRPVVFFRHGLWVAFFAMTVFVATLALWRGSKETSGKYDPRYLYAAGYLGIVLVLCKSLASLMYGLFLLPIVLLLKTRTQLWIAAGLVLLSLTYPILRAAHLVPTDTILEWAEAIDPDRRKSLYVRLYNEEMLLDHARERILFGWGTWGRSRIYDAETGEDISTTDGYWAIIIGSYGWVGYLATFGLLGLPVLRMWRSGIPPPQVTCALGLLVAINMIEILPNSTLPPWTWLIAGALLGHASQRASAPQTPSTEMAARPPRTVL